MDSLDDVESETFLLIAEPNILSPLDTTPPTAKLTPPVTGASAAPRSDAAEVTPLIVLPATLSSDIEYEVEAPCVLLFV